MRDTRNDILSFWFIEIDPSQWFDNDPIFDDDLTNRFLLPYDMACEGLNDDWALSASGSLALCLLLSQFPRNMFRGTSRVFATDKDALAIARQAIAKGFDQMLPPEQRIFLYLPFERSEKPKDQIRNIELFEMLALENPKAFKKARHKFNVFQKFGRFPERNAILNRTNTKAEEAFLKSLL